MIKYWLDLQRHIMSGFLTNTPIILSQFASWTVKGENDKLVSSSHSYKNKELLISEWRIVMAPHLPSSHFSTSGLPTPYYFLTSCEVCLN